MFWSIRRVSPSQARSRIISRQRFQPVLEALEDRWLPSTFTWFQNVDGDFNDASRWQDQAGRNGVPGPNDDAIIPRSGFTVTASVDNTIRSLNASSRLTLVGGTFTVGDVINSSAINQLVVESGASFQVTAGTTSLTGGTESLGSFTVAAGAKLVISGGTHHMDTGTSLGGPGEYHLSGGTLSIDADVNAPANFFLDGGTLSGPRNFTSNGNFTWLSGGMSGTGTTTIPSGGTLAMSGLDRKLLDQRTLDTLGNTIITGTGGLATQNGATWINEAGATVDDQVDWGIFYTGAGGTLPPGLTLNNFGTFQKSSGAGTTLIDRFVLFNNNGTVNVQSGTLDLRGGGASTGAFTAAAGASLSFSGGVYTLNAGTSLAGNGTTSVPGADVEVNAAVSAQNVTVNGGNIGGGGTLTVAGAFVWTGGSMNGTGTTTIAASGSLTMSGLNRNVLDQRTLDTFGNTIITGTTVGFGTQNGATWINESGATVDDQVDWSIYYTGSGGTHAPGLTLNNFGTFQKSGGPGTTLVSGHSGEVLLNNNGTVNVQSGNLDLRGGGSSTGTFDVAAGSTLYFSGGTSYLNGGAAITDAGLAVVTSGQLAITGTVSAQNLGVQGDGALYLTRTGILNVSGIYQQTGFLVYDIAGPNLGTDFGQLNVTGKAQLGGTLIINTINGYRPDPGNTFQIMTFGSLDGNFTGARGFDLGGGRYYGMAIDATSLTLVVSGG